MSDKAGSLIHGDETAVWGKDQSWALVWFIITIAIVPVFVYSLARIDSWMYFNDAKVEIAGVEIFDEKAHSENRHALYNIGVFDTDQRTKTSLHSAYEKLANR